MWRSEAGVTLRFSRAVRVAGAVSLWIAALVVLLVTVPSDQQGDNYLLTFFSARHVFLLSASWLYYGANIVALGGAAVVAARAMAPRADRLVASGAVLAAFVSFAPIRRTLQIGQTGIFVLFMVMLAMVLLTARRSDGLQRHSFAAGVLLGIASVIKVYPAGIAAFAVLHRPTRWPVLGGAVAAVCVLLGLATIIAGPLIWTGYSHTLGMLNNPFFIASPEAFGSVTFAYRALTATPYSAPLIALSAAAAWITYGFYATTMMGVIGAVIRRAGAITIEGLALAAATTLLIFPVLESHHLTLLMAVLPLVAGCLIARYGDVAGKLLALTGISTGLCLLLALGQPWIPATALALATLIAALAMAVLALTMLVRSPVPAATILGVTLVTFSFVTLASPAAGDLLGSVGLHLTPYQVVLVEAPFFSLGILAVGLALIRRGS